MGEEVDVVVCCQQMILCFLLHFYIVFFLVGMFDFKIALEWKNCTLCN